MSRSASFRLENLIKEYKQALKTSEEEVQQLQRRVSSQAPPPITMTTPSRFATPGRSPPHSPSVDTPSKDVVLDPEPHGAEFEVSSVLRFYSKYYFVNFKRLNTAQYLHSFNYI